MPNRVTYEYAVIRLVPKVEREEFLNIGIILFSKRKKYLGIKYNIDTTRLHAFSADIDTDMILGYLKGWELVCEGGPTSGPIGQQAQSFRFRWLVASRSTIIQSSPTHPGRCEAPEQVLKELFKRYVL